MCLLNDCHCLFETSFFAGDLLMFLGWVMIFLEKHILNCFPKKINTMFLYVSSEIPPFSPWFSKGNRSLSPAAAPQPRGVLSPRPGLAQSVAPRWCQVVSQWTGLGRWGASRCVAVSVALKWEKMLEKPSINGSSMVMDNLWLVVNSYPLVNKQFAIEHGHRNSGFSH